MKNGGKFSSNYDDYGSQFLTGSSINGFQSLFFGSCPSGRTAASTSNELNFKVYTRTEVLAKQLKLVAVRPLSSVTVTLIG